jgi:hypothetical protein
MAEHPAAQGGLQDGTKDVCGPNSIMQVGQVRTPTVLAHCMGLFWKPAMICVATAATIAFCDRCDLAGLAAVVAGGRWRLSGSVCCGCDWRRLAYMMSVHE